MVRCMTNAKSSVPDWAKVIIVSYQTLLGAPLVPGGLTPEAQAIWLDAAPFVLLAHDGGVQPRFVYANAAAQRCFEYSRDELIGMPSQLSAEPMHRAERESLLRAVARDGYTRGYCGVRVAKSGRRFAIDNAIVWNLIDVRGQRVGQAARFECPAGIT